jgi:twitching motility two-component system response regulator PilH
LARKILLADDSVTAQNMGRKILADAGYEVIAVNNGSAALKKIAELKPDLVILDVYMPGYSGLEVCQRLKESQETARIPVLLSVGKLEPFKPEEAQRVRADAFIVKPFEASELLSALSKLEDKVVPRAEPTKPGRFARAMAAAEEAGRGSRKETASDPNGWSSRIGFPHEKTGPEEKVADESSIYNPMNRDLRTVVETTAEKAAEKKADEAIVDVAALAPEGLPKDVTPEEVAAIAAAAAQIQMAGAEGEDEHLIGESRSFESEISQPQISEPQISEPQISEPQISEPQISEPQISEPQIPEPRSEAPSEESLAPPPERVEDKLAPPVLEEAKTEAAQENKIDGVAGEAAAAGAELYSAETHVNGDARAQETQDLPVTMAVATSESAAAVSVEGSRWTAVPTSLDGEEATISLEQEMQKAYAAFAPYVAAETESASGAAGPEADAAIARDSSTSEVEPVVEAAPAENFSSPEVATSVADATISPAIVAEPDATEAPVAEPMNSAAPDPTGLVAQEAPEAQESQPQELQPVPEAEPVLAETATASSGDVAPSAEGVEPAGEDKPDSDAVRSTAAAWASWRQIRDTRKDGEVAPVESKEFEISESAPAETAAMAVAAGAEHVLQEAAAAPKGDPGDVASIVESVLANLRPKLMEEISRKMAEKK